MMGVTRVGIRDAYYVAMRERTRKFADASCALIRVPFNDDRSNRERANSAIRIVIFLTSVSVWLEIIQNSYVKIEAKSKREFLIERHFFINFREAYIYWLTELERFNYTDISDYRFDFDSIFNYRE